MSPPTTILILTGEASGDLHGAELARALARLQPGLRILGMGGAHMKEAGVELIFDTRDLGVMGVVEVLTKWRTVLKAFGAAKAALKSGVDAAVLIDSPDFNLRIAKTARRFGIPTVYYIGPKIWAWRGGRIRTIARRVDRMLVIFPFEEPLYRSAGVPCEFVGHPLMDEISELPKREVSRERLGLPANGTVVALLPGSRRMEIERLMNPMVGAFERIRTKRPDAVGVLPVASSIAMEEIRGRLGAARDSIRLVLGKAPLVLSAADVAIVASGTATLEAAIAGAPMVVVYKVSPLTALIGRLLIRIRDVSLVNIVAGRRVAPELLQADASPENIADAALRLLSDPSAAAEMKASLAEIRRRLGPPGAAGRAAEAVLKALPRAGRTAAA